jgi:hypothetical protein
MPVPAPDEELSTRQASLHAEAEQILGELELAGLFDGLGPLLPAGSYVSGLMCWRDLDLMALVGADFAPRDVLRLLRRIVDMPGVTGFDYRDERGPRSPTGQVRDQRYHLPVTLLRGGASWRIDLTLWLHDPHANVTAWHEALRDRITDEQRRAVLRIKDVWHRRPEYPDRVGGMEIYTAVIEDGVRTPERFGAWLTERGS